MSASVFPRARHSGQDLLRRRLDEPNYRTLGNQMAAAWRPDANSRSDDAKRTAFLRVLDQGIGPGFRERTDALHTKINAVIKRLGGDPLERHPDASRSEIAGPASSRFKLRKLPERMRTVRDTQEDAAQDDAAPAGMAPLPDGYWLIRAESKGNRAVAISVSQNLDPTGEISRGGALGPCVR